VDKNIKSSLGFFLLFLFLEFTTKNFIKVYEKNESIKHIVSFFLFMFVLFVLVFPPFPNCFFSACI